MWGKGSQQRVRAYAEAMGWEPAGPPEEQRGGWCGQNRVKAGSREGRKASARRWPRHRERGVGGRRGTERVQG